MPRFPLLLLFIFSCLLTFTACPKDPPTHKKPNILFIFSDDHAIQSIGAYGSIINQTPNIDRIAKGGMIFRRSYCTNSICAPSRATILTGKHSHANGKMTNLDTFDGAQQTFPKLLQAAGYQTALIGKWHLKSKPTGFDHYKILPGQGSYYNPDIITPDDTIRIEGYNTDIITDEALGWLDLFGNEEKPFMLMCQYKAPHRTWAPGPDHLSMYDSVTVPEPPSLFDDYSGRSAFLKDNEMEIGRHLMYEYDLKIAGSTEKDVLGRAFKNPELRRMTKEQRKLWDDAYESKNLAFLEADLSGEELVRWKYQRYIKDYLRTVASVDDNIGRILDHLEELGLAENTLVIYSSDQGFYLGEHGWYDKRWMYEESLSMPFLARWPKVIQAGTESSALIQNIDYAPTFLEMAGVEIPGDIQGNSLLPLFKGETPQDWRKGIYYHYYEEGEHNVPKHEGIRTKRYKLIHFYGRDTYELFDLAKDPNEMKSLYEQEEYQEIGEALKDSLRGLKEVYGVLP